MRIKRNCYPIFLLCSVSLVFLMAGCGGTSPSVSYYSLSSLDQASIGSEIMNTSDVSLGIGPVTVPEYLKKAQIATRVGDGNRYQFDEFHRWAGIVEKDIAAAIGNNLGAMLGSDRIAFFPWMHYFKPQYRVVIEIIQFDSDLNSDAVLSSRWAVADGAGENIMVSGKSDYRRTLKNPSYDALVDAEKLLLADLSKEIADEVSKLSLQK